MQSRSVRTLTLAIGALAVALLACGKKDTYSPSCKAGVPLSSPWSGMALPVEDGRVCSSTSNRTEVQFTSGSSEDHMNAFETRVVASGFSKQSCESTRCTYQRGKDRLNLMRMDAKKWKTIVLWM